MGERDGSMSVGAHAPVAEEEEAEGRSSANFSASSISWLIPSGRTTERGMSYIPNESRLEPGDVVGYRAADPAEQELGCRFARGDRREGRRGVADRQPRS